MKRVNHIKVSIRKNNCLKISLPVDAMELLNSPERVIVREYPFSISAVGMNDKRSAKVTLNTICRDGDVSFSPSTFIDDFVGLYSYELDDMTLYLEKIK